VTIISTNKINTDKPGGGPSVLDPPEKNLGDDDFLNRNPNKINLKAERCCRSVAQTVSESASTANSRKGQQRHGVGKIRKDVTGWPESKDKGTEYHNRVYYFMYIFLITL